MQPSLKTNLKNTLSDSAIPAVARGQILVDGSREFGPPMYGLAAEIIERSDRCEAAEERAKSCEARLAELEAKRTEPLQPGVFYRSIEQAGQPHAIVLCEAGPLVCPSDIALDQVRRGDFVLLDRSRGAVVARDGAIVPAGDIARVDRVPDSPDGLVTISYRDQRCAAYASETAWRSGDLRPGAEVIYDPLRRFIHAVERGTEDGSDLLVPVASLSGFRLEDLGAPNPVLFDIFRLIRRGVTRPEWVARMRARNRHSFFFSGPSGAGKTAHLAALSNLVTDWLEELSGERMSRICHADASSFYSPFFGEAETKTIAWFRKLGAIARKEVDTKDGRRIRVPLIVIFEEVEHLFRKRGEVGGSAHLFDRNLSLILKEMDSLRNDLDTPCIFIATSNLKSLVDVAARRRLGLREVCFPTLSAPAALAVLEKKIPPDMPVLGGGSDPVAARRTLTRAAVHYLYGDGDDQAIAEVVLSNSSRVIVERRSLVTGALIEAAVSQSIDECLDRSEEVGALIGLSEESLVRALAGQFEAIATSLSRHNVADYAPHLFDESVPATGVRVLAGARRRPALHYASAG